MVVHVHAPFPLPVLHALAMFMHVHVHAPFSLPLLGDTSPPLPSLPSPPQVVTEDGVTKSFTTEGRLICEHDDRGEGK